MYKPHILLAALGLCVLATGCDSGTPSSTAPSDAARLGASADARTAPSGSPDALFEAQLDAINVALAADGAGYRAAMVEWVAGPDAEFAGNTVLAKNVGNKQLTADFVPGDARRSWNTGSGITYAVDQVDAVPYSYTVGYVIPGASGPEATAAIQSSMGTWDAASCSTLPLTQADDLGLDLGYIAALNGLGGSFAIVADVMHAGFTDINFAGGVLGATYTLIWTDAGVPTDIDHNGKADVAFREIYYDPSWIWGDGDGTSVDVESIALHEVGHALSQAHFGTVRLKHDGSLVANPRAVMNALYPGGAYRQLAGSDNGGHCSLWANWPIH